MTSSPDGRVPPGPAKPFVVVRTRNRSRVPGPDERAARKCRPPSPDQRRAGPPQGNPLNPAAALYALADRVNRLTVSRRDPDRFFEERSEISAALRRLADQLR